MASMEPLNRMVRMVARPFYDDVSLVRDPKSARGDNCGLAVVVLDALTRRHHWVREEDLAKALKISSKQLRRILQFFEEEKLVRRCHRREVYDVTLYRIHEMKKKLKDELDESYMIQNYVCPNCERRYSSLDALDLVSHNDNNFHCEHCNEELLQDFGNIAWGGRRNDGDNARRDRRMKLKDFLQRMERQMEPLISQMNKVKDLDFPQFQTLETWERNIRENANGDDVSTPMLFLGEAHEHQKGSSLDIGADEEVLEVGVQNTRPIPSCIIRKDIDHMGDKEDQLRILEAQWSEQYNKNQMSMEDNYDKIQDERQFGIKWKRDDTMHVCADESDLV